MKMKWRNKPKNVCRIVQKERASWIISLKFLIFSCTEPGNFIHVWKITVVHIFEKLCPTTGCCLSTRFHKIASFVLRCSEAWFCVHCSFSFLWPSLEEHCKNKELTKFFIAPFAFRSFLVFKHLSLFIEENCGYVEDCLLNDFEQYVKLISI